MGRQVRYYQVESCPKLTLYYLALILGVMKKISIQPYSCWYFRDNASFEVKIVQIRNVYHVFFCRDSQLGLLRKQVAYGAEV